eukprot:TRINITY_DN13367_c0_g1_i1.p1 TRINITY_DN13367_c0_g1~~TRINITY_DN13367_c0_g1_i1.p1  ORF type:complete len:127 (-),score=9.73 TRINITY_DN13367_c0_g1_i1:66-398(-)
MDNKEIIKSGDILTRLITNEIHPWRIQTIQITPHALQINQRRYDSQLLRKASINWHQVYQVSYINGVVQVKCSEGIYEVKDRHDESVTYEWWRAISVMQVALFCDMFGPF